MAILYAEHYSYHTTFVEFILKHNIGSVFQAQCSTL